MSTPPPAAPLPNWVMPPPEGFVADDLDRLPGLPPHTELIDGSLVFVSPQRTFHSLAIDLLVSGLRRQTPEHLRVRREMTITLDVRQRPEPDLMVVRASAVTGMNQVTFHPEDVLLAIEVVSPDSEVRDRERKPELYARAGIQHYWMVENVSERPQVIMKELPPGAREYAHVDIQYGHLKHDFPFPVDIDLTEIEQF